MKCQFCGCIDSKVIDSRPTDDGFSIRRRRECIGCGRRFTTYEKMELSPLWRQMLADVMNCPVATTVNTEGPALGVAILAGVGAGLYGSVQEACRAMIHVNPAQEPIAENVPKYAKVYEVFKKLYTANKELYKDLGTID